MNDNSIAIETFNLSKNYGNLTAVNKLNLKIKSGEIFGFLGSNGAGKTTTIKMMTGLLKPTSGTVKIMGKDIQENPIEAKKYIGLIPDQPKIYEKLTGVEFLRFMGNIFGMGKEKIEEKIIEAVNLISSRGGYVSNPLNVSLVEGDISYLCYNLNYYLPCINQEPMLINHLEDEVKNYVGRGVRDCVDNFVLSLEEQGYIVDLKYNDFEIEILSGKVEVDIDAEIVYSKSGEQLKIEGVHSVVKSKFYNNAVIVQEIVSQEARYCNFEFLGFMLLYPEYDIDKFRTEDGSVVYWVKERESEEEFKFAVRSCAIPPGL